MPFIPGAGHKKPLNQLEGPIYPDIKQAPPRFVWSRKHWDVDVGATLRDTEPITQFYENAVLAQSRDYNKTVYGQSSHKDIVNAAFRPPLLDPIEDFFPLTRIPATSRAIIPHINPSTVSDNGTSGYLAKNERMSGVESALSDRVSGGQWRPTFYAPIEIPQDNAVLPDLEAQLPSVSIFSGWEFPKNMGCLSDEWEDKSIIVDEKPSSLLDTGYNSQIKIYGDSGLENISLSDNRPNVSVSAGINTPVSLNAETPTPQLHPNRPSVSVSAGVNTPVNLDAEIHSPNLHYNRPSVSVSSGVNTPVNFDMESPYENIELSTKVENIPISVINPGSENGYHERQSMYVSPDEFIVDKRPSYSYVVPGEEPYYREKNELTHQPHFRQKLQPHKSYGQISQSGGYIPSSNIHTPTFGIPVTKNETRKVKYRF